MLILIVADQNTISILLSSPIFYMQGGGHFGRKRLTKRTDKKQNPEHKNINKLLNGLTLT